jgi:hypothetical protein
MPIPANTNTTEYAILNQVVTELQTISGMNSANVFISAFATFLPSPPGDVYIEVVPGVAQDMQAKQGIGALKDQINICVFWRFFGDQDGRDSARLADSTNGLFQFLATVEQKLIASFLAGKALVPMLPDRREAAERNPQDPADGWVMVKRSFNVEYLYSFPGPQSTS